MANKTQLATVGEQQAAVVINNQFIDGLTKQLEEKCKYGLSFPKDYNLSNALMGAYLVLKETKDKNNKPVLESCTSTSIANSLMNMATLGLSVQKKQGYFVSYAGQCQFQRSYFGNITIARRYGMKDVHAEIIYPGDKFKYHIEDGNKVLDSHEQEFMNIDNDKILGAYAVVLMEDGTKHLEVMNMKQIKQAWLQGYGYKENGNGTHQKFTDQMAKKTVINRALKQIINTHGDVFVQEADNDTETVSRDDAFAADVACEIEQNANKEEFIPEPMAIEEQPKQPTVAEFVQSAEKEPVPAAVVEPEIPDFMKQEEM
jgi:recombination protein RecT